MQISSEDFCLKTKKSDIFILLNENASSAKEIFFEYISRPTTEKCNLATVITITDSQNNVKIVWIDLIALFAIITHIFQNGICAILVLFIGKVDICNVFCDSRLSHSKKIWYLLLRKACCLILQADFQLNPNQTIVSCLTIPKPATGCPAGITTFHSVIPDPATGCPAGITTFHSVIPGPATGYRTSKITKVSHI